MSFDASAISYTRIVYLEASNKLVVANRSIPGLMSFDPTFNTSTLIVIPIASSLAPSFSIDGEYYVFNAVYAPPNSTKLSSSSLKT